MGVLGSVMGDDIHDEEAPNGTIESKKVSPSGSPHNNDADPYLAFN